jgi:flagellar basal-body rod protein FlgC
MAFLSGMDISGSALSAQRTRMDIISDNIANTDTAKYKKKYVVFEQITSDFQNIMNRLTGQSGNDYKGGVRISSVEEDDTLGDLIYDPSHPSADENGYFEASNVDVTTEMVDMISAYRSYEANITALNTYKDMAVKALEIGV